MPAIPLPFVVSFLLVILLARLIAQRERALRPAVVFVAAWALVQALVGLRWTFNIQGIQLITPVAAALLPAIAWFCFAGLTGMRSARRLWLDMLPTGVAVVLSLVFWSWFDLILVSLSFGYGFALVRLASRGPDDFVATRFSDASKMPRATLMAGLALICFGAVDILIAGDFDLYRGVHAAWIITIVDAITLPLIAYAAGVVGNSVSTPEIPEVAQDALEERRPESAFPAEDDERIVETVAALMREKQLFRDPDLTLNHLARRAGIPARRISAAINRVQGRSVSQLVNEYRVDEAKRLLASSALPVTTIMLESGFQTKSNFNREFRRSTGMSPSDFRRACTT